VSRPKLMAHDHLRRSVPTARICKINPNSRSIQSENDATFLIEALLGDDVRPGANQLGLAVDATRHPVKSNSFPGVIEAESRAAKKSRLKGRASSFQQVPNLLCVSERVVET